MRVERSSCGRSSRASRGSIRTLRPGHDVRDTSTSRQLVIVIKRNAQKPLHREAEDSHRQSAGIPAGRSTTKNPLSRQGYISTCQQVPCCRASFQGRRKGSSELCWQEETCLVMRCVFPTTKACSQHESRHLCWGTNAQSSLRDCYSFHTSERKRLPNPTPTCRLVVHRRQRGRG